MALEKEDGAEGHDCSPLYVQTVGRDDMHGAICSPSAAHGLSQRRRVMGEPYPLPRARNKAVRQSHRVGHIGDFVIYGRTGRRLQRRLEYQRRLMKGGSHV